MCFSNCFSCAIQDLHLFILYHECTNGTMPSTLLVLRTIPPILRTFPPNRPKWVHFCRTLPHSAKKSPFPGIKKAGRERTLSGQMKPLLHFFPSEGSLLSIQPYILTSHQSKHAKITTQASYQNLGGYMASYAYFDTKCKIKRQPEIGCIFHLGGCKMCKVKREEIAQEICSRLRGKFPG